MPTVGKQIIHEHEEMAEKLAIVLYVLGVISIAGIYLNFKNHSKAQLVSFAALVVAIVGVFFAKETGTTGGEVRHTEIRANAVPGAAAEQNAITGDKGENEDKD